MSKKDEDSLPTIMRTLRQLKGNLEVVCADALRDFERSSGLTVEDIELIRNTSMDMGASRTEQTRITSVRITMRL